MIVYREKTSQSYANDIHCGTCGSRYKGRNLQIAQCLCHDTCYENHRRNFAFVSEDECNGVECKGDVSRHTSNRDEFKRDLLIRLERAGWSIWQIKDDIQICTWMWHPQCTGCCEDGCNMEMWHVWRVPVQPEECPNTWIDSSGDKRWRPTSQFYLHSAACSRHHGCSHIDQNHLCWMVLTGAYRCVHGVCCHWTHSGGANLCNVAGPGEVNDRMAHGHILRWVLLLFLQW